MTGNPPKPKRRKRGVPVGGNLGIPVALRAQSEDQKAAWQAAAARARRNLTDWIRVTLDDAAQGEGN
jgi:hypothetical protein